MGAVVSPPANDEFSMIADWVRATNGGILSIISSELKPLQFHGFFLPLLSLLILLGSQEEIGDTYRWKY
ncbi:hypothetical protein [Bradyrhizobium sp. CB2312]|uniref:hypothetical protein n=1 Tax=Bradyrhizobium sp. CB2312 TaxID=3039155 RepID=UPI0024B1B8EE|nr:hypothetical protein [Bradyrhizobium sp. CB2312]WFU74163.1 hypothetical protein QA642_08985 [Bradyrhizobium sp. CB2312]